MKKEQLFYEAKADLNMSLILIPSSLDKFRNFCINNKGNLELNGLEVIILWQHDNDKVALFDIIVEFHLINWLVIHTEKCSVATAINRALAEASKKIITVSINFDFFDQLSLFKTYCLLHQYANSFLAIYSCTDTPFGVEQFIASPFVLSFWRDVLSKIGDAHTFQNPAHVLVNLIKRLQKAGTRKLNFFEPIFSQVPQTDHDPENPSTRERRQIYYPAYTERHSLPKGHGSVIYDWKQGSLGFRRCVEYLKSFKKSEVVQKDCFEKRYRVIALMQTYNEIRNMPAVLEYLDNYCDGIILLDDESSDGTFEHAMSKKLLLKVQKTRNGFEDARNRNILLDLVSFFSVDWIFTLDADERFDPRYNDIYKLLDSPFDVLCFRYVNLWDSEKTYRVDFDPTNNNGVSFRRRMFRSMGRAQIYTPDNRKIHVNPVPTLANHGFTKIMVLHYGTLSFEARQNKVNFYLREDPIEINYKTWYRFFEDTKVVVAKVDDIVL